MGDLLNKKLEDTYYTNDELLSIDGFDEAAMGVASRCGLDVLVYDRAKIVEKLIDRDGMTHEDAEEYIDFNIVGSYVGESTPLVLTAFNEED